jgi:dinuclear metal center YbgI/SA1388 family protein
MSVKVKEIQRWMDSRYPPGWAEEWDRIGLQLGDPEQPVERLGVSLEATPRSVSWAIQKGLHLIISHHPLFFEALTGLNSRIEPGRTASQILKADMALLVAHTNLDAAPDGVSTALADRLGMTDLLPLERGTGDWVKLVLFIPIGYEERIFNLLDAPHTGRIGPYRRCTFKCRGEGTFVPDTGSRPFKGESGCLERASEWRLEILTSRVDLHELIEKIRQAHPYETMAYDIYPVENAHGQIGLGRIGRFDPAIGWEELIRRLKQEVEAPWVRVSGVIPSKAEKIAVCGGSGSRLISKALSAGASIFICGEVGYHPIVSYEGQGGTLLEIGHYPSEKWIIPVLAESLREADRREGWGIEVFENREPGDPYSQYF